MRSDAARVEHLIDLIRFRHQPCGEILFDIKGVPWVRVRQILIIGVTGDVVLIREEGAHSPKLQDALAAVQHRQLVYRGKVFATKSSGEFPKGKRHKRNPSFISLAFLFCFDIIYGITFNLGQKKAGNLFRFPA